MDKKANSLITGLILLVVAIMLVGAFTIPQIKTAVNSQSYSDSIVYQPRNATNNVSFTLTKTTSLQTGSLVITGLVLNTNYTIDYTTGIVKILANTTNNATYTASYNYYESNYINTNSTDRALYGFLAVLFIIGLIYATIKIFGLL